MDIKFKMSELIVQYGPIPGLIYVSNYILYPEKLLQIVVQQCKFEVLSSSKNSRRVAHFGYAYKYDRTGLSIAEDIPECFKQLISRDTLNDLTGRICPEFDQIIVNEYRKSQGISPHIDHKTLFGDIIGGISLGAKCDMILKKNQEQIILPLDIGSLFLLTGDARYKWTHSLTNKSNNTRYSITFRHVV